MRTFTKLLQYFRRNLFLSILLLILIFSLLGAYIFYAVEARVNPGLTSFSKAVWWSIVTITTVGYGDLVPMTEIGRWLGIFVIFTGVAIVSTFTALISSVFVSQKLKEERGLKQLSESDHIIVCGWNHTAEKMIETILSGEKHKTIVLINQLAEDQIQNVLMRFEKRGVRYVRGDFAQEEVLNRANIRQAHAVLILPDSSLGINQRSDEKTILTAFSVKAIQPKIKVYAHILDHENEAYLKKAQVNDYIISDALSGVLLGEMIAAPGISQSLHNIVNQQNISRVPLPAAYAGKSFGEVLADFRKKNQLPIAIVREQKTLELQDVLSEDYSYLDEFIERKFKEAGKTIKRGAALDVVTNPSDELLMEAGMHLIILN